MLVYLSGSIEYAPDKGKGWRAQVTPMLEALGHSVYDPASDERKNLSEDERLNFRAWKTADLPRFQQTVRKIIAWDLDWIEHRAGAIVCYWDQYCPAGAGTQGELTFAHRRGIPVYLVLGVERGQVSGWILGCATHVFASFAELERFLRSAAPAERSTAVAVPTGYQESL